MDDSIRDVQGSLAIVNRFRKEISARFHAHPRWIVLDEFPVDHGENGKGRIDLYAISCDPEGTIRRVAYEIKLSRRDFIQERRHPEKRARAEAVCDYFYFVVPKGLVTEREIRSPYGLIEISERFFIRGYAKKATKLLTPEPSPAFMMDVARRKYQIGYRHGAVLCSSGIVSLLIDMIQIPVKNKAWVNRRKDIVFQLCYVLRKMRCNPEANELARRFEGSLVNGNVIRRRLLGWRFAGRNKHAVPIFNQDSADLPNDAISNPDDLDTKNFTEF